MKDINRVNKLRRECERAQEKLDELETFAEKLTGHITDINVSSTPTPMDEWWARYIDQKDYYQSKLLRYVEESAALEKELDSIENNSVRLALKYRYLDGMRVTDIADIMYFSERQVYLLLKKGRKVYNEL